VVLLNLRRKDGDLILGRGLFCISEYLRFEIEHLSEQKSILFLSTYILPIIPINIATLKVPRAPSRRRKGSSTMQYAPIIELAIRDQGITMARVPGSSLVSNIISGRLTVSSNSL
jgi:hypothetical protein